MKFPTLPNLDGLIGLSRRGGVDIRPILVRVLTDLYVQKLVHTREEEQHYTELCLSLLGGLDVPTRSAVARKLAAYPAAPLQVISYLARDVFEVAEPVLLESQCVSSEELVRIANDLGGRHANAIAAREVVPSAQAGSAPVIPPLPSAGEAAAAPQETGLPPITPESDLGEYFLQAAPSERCLLLSRLDTSAEPVEIRAAAPDEIAVLEKAAFQRNLDAFARGLEASLFLPHEKAQRVARDETGEAIVVAAKSLGMSMITLQRVLLFLNPRIGESIERVFSMIKLYNEITPAAALRVTASWCTSAAPEKRPPHRPLHWDDAAQSGRRAALDYARGARAPLQTSRPQPTSLPGLASLGQSKT